jgi:hypothetical protein
MPPEVGASLEFPLSANYKLLPSFAEQTLASSLGREPIDCRLARGVQHKQPQEALLQ